MLISVCVPVYQTEKLVIRCVKSILNQSFAEFELLLVNDGSTDGSGQVIDELAAMDSRIKVFHNAHTGLAHARQTAIKAASGEYILNVDSDDYLPQGVFEMAADIINNYHPDYISFADEVFNEHGSRTEKSIMPQGYYDKEAVKNKILPNILLNSKNKYIKYYLAGRFIRRDKLILSQMSVPPTQTTAEDLLCMSTAWFSFNSAYFDSRTGYCIYERYGSDSRGFSLDRMHKYDAIIEFLDNVSDGHEVLKPQLDRYCMHIVFLMLHYMAMDWDSAQLCELTEYFKKPLYREHIKNAVFENVTLKTRIVYWLIRKGDINSAYAVMRLANRLKNALGIER